MFFRGFVATTFSLPIDGASDCPLSFSLSAPLVPLALPLSLSLSLASQLMPHWSVWPLAVVGTVAFSLWIATCCFGEEKLRALLGRRAAEASAADSVALPGRVGADRPTSDLLTDLERS